MLLFPVFLGLITGVIGINSLNTGLPFGRAHFTNLIVILECLNESQNLIYVSANRGIIVLTVSEDSLTVNDESSSQGERIVLDKASVVLADLLCHVSNHRDVHTAEATLVSGLVGEFLMDEMRVARASDHFGTYKKKESILVLNIFLPFFLNSSALALNSTISVGQTKVKSRG